MKSALSTDLHRDLSALANTTYVGDNSVPNGSSIAFVLEHRGHQLLFLGDAHAEDYEPAYARWRETQADAASPTLVKLSHHGSQRNTTPGFASIGAQSYVISSSGGRFGHPDDATLARLITNAPADRPPRFWFNYDTPANQRWAELAAYDSRFTVAFPDAPGQGVAIVIGRRGA